MPRRETGNGLSDIIRIIAEGVAFVTVALYVVLIANANWPFIPEGTFLDILNVCKFYAPLALVLLVGIQSVSRRPLVIRILFYAIVAAIIIFQFFPETWANFVNIL